LWLEPWDGVTAIPFEQLHPHYIEICRRIRLGLAHGQVTCRAAGSASPRIRGAAELKGNTGDPWMPVGADGKGLSLSADGFSYRKLAELLHPAKFQLPILAKAGGNEPQEDLVWVARSICRGQGKTEGYHERRIPLSRKALATLATRQETVADIAESHVMALNELRLAFRAALCSMTEGTPGKAATDKVTPARFAEPWLARLEREAEEDFFEDLWDEAGAEETERSRILIEWLKRQRLRGQQLLIEAAGSMPQPVTRRYKALAQAQIAFRGKLAKSTAFAPLSNQKTP
jgi:CRISPR system Cascade subunit CasA